MPRNKHDRSRHRRQKKETGLTHLLVGRIARPDYAHRSERRLNEEHARLTSGDGQSRRRFERTRRVIRSECSSDDESRGRSTSRMSESGPSRSISGSKSRPLTVSSGSNSTAESCRRTLSEMDISGDPGPSSSRNARRRDARHKSPDRRRKSRHDSTDVPMDIDRQDDSSNEMSDEDMSGSTTGKEKLFNTSGQMKRMDGAVDRKFMMCPFLVHTPGRYRACADYIMYDSTSVKRHVLSRHSSLMRECVKCNKVFKAYTSSGKKNAHEDFCPEGGSRFPRYGMTAAQEDQIKNWPTGYDRKPRMSADDVLALELARWNFLWTTLFPGDPRRATANSILRPSSHQMVEIQKEAARNLRTKMNRTVADRVKEMTMSALPSAGGKPKMRAHACADALTDELIEIFERMLEDTWERTFQGVVKSPRGDRRR